MKLKTSKVVEIVTVLREFKKRPGLPGIIAFKLAGILRPLNPIAEEFSEAQQAVAKKHGTPSEDQPGAFVFLETDADGKAVIDSETKKPKFSRAKFEAYTAEMKAILEQEHEIDESKVEQKEFDKIDISVDEADALSYFVA